MKLRFWQLALVLIVMAGCLTTQAEAREISRECTLDCTVWSASDAIRDNDPYAPFRLPAGTSITLTHPEGISSLYLIFDWAPGEYSVTDNTSGSTCTWGSQGFYHEFLDLEASFQSVPTSVTLDFGDKEVWLNEAHVFSPGPVPDWVQRWEAPADARADLLLFSAHCDDEQLFFAGSLPYYAGELGYRVQVVYMTDHKNMTSWRVHEALDGLWNVGVRRYPVFAPFPDAYSRSREYSYKRYQYDGVSREELTGFVVEQLRHFRPQVVLTHDVNGEYGHGQHMTTADTVMLASMSSWDLSAFPESAERYGVWDTPKVYLHLYPLDTIWMDWDQPLERFGGMTAYQVTRDLGFPSHVSQVKDFAWYMRGCNTAAEIRLYNPCAYGLYYSSVGKDVAKNDFFEHLIPYDRQDQLAQEAAQLSALRQEEAQREAERLIEEQKAEEAARLQAELLAAQEAEQAAAQTARDKADRIQRVFALAIAIGTVLTALGAMWYPRKII